MSILKRVASAALALTLAAGMNVMPVMAADTALTNGDYTATVHFYRGDNPANTSMCDSIFVHTADVTLTNDAAELTFYVAYPVPSFSEQGTDGTIKDVKMTYEGKDYAGESDITTKAKKTFDTTGALFGINAGDELETQAITVSLPRTAVASFEDGIATSAYVDVVMHSTQNFVVKVTGLPEAAKPTTTDDSQSAKVTANVAAATPDYAVTIPSSITLGTLSDETDNSETFTVDVTAENLGTGKVQITTAAAGELTSESGSGTLAFSNSFGTKETSESTKLTGVITVKAADVKAAAAGNYTGTANFTINYYAGE